MKLMKSVCNPLRNNSLAAVSLLAVLALFVVGCKGGGGGGRTERICEDYCHRLDTECADIPRAEDDCIAVCVDDIEEADDLDGSACVDAQLDAFACAADLDDCDDVFEFADVERTDPPLAFCTAEVNDVFTFCLNSVE